MSHDAIIQIVQKGDPDRFLATMAAPQNLRADLFTLFAFNVEVARAPWASAQEMIAEMRLQFWRDALQDQHQGQSHELLLPLQDLIRRHELPLETFDQMIAARQWDIYREPFENQAAFVRHIDQTAGNLIWLAARLGGANATSQPAVRDYAFGVGVANWLVAVPQLQARGRQPLLNTDHASIRALASDALNKMQSADQALLKPAAAALRSGWLAKGILKTAMCNPERMQQGRLQVSEFSRRSGLLLRSLSGRW